MAEALDLPEVLAQALTTKAVMLNSAGRRQEALALLRFALWLATEHDKPSTALRASYNLCDQLAQFERYDEAIVAADDALAQSRRFGTRFWELSFLGQIYPYLAAGRWDDALDRFAELPIDNWEESRLAFATSPFLLAFIAAPRGTMAEVRADVERFQAMSESATCGGAVRVRGGTGSGALRRWRLSGSPGGGEQRVRRARELGIGAEQVKESYVVAVEAAFALGEMTTVEALLMEWKRFRGEA